MTDREMAGYDSAQRTRIADNLGRWRFAAEIAEVIRSTPPEWSARIGVFGRWGEGKSTILHFLDQMLKPEGNIVLYFNPWAVRGLDQMWAEFGKNLMEALEKDGLLAESALREAARTIQQRLGSSDVPELAGGASEFFGHDRNLKSAFALVEKWLNPDGEQVHKIRERLGNKRLIVFIDDLDRANPELLPKLLLSLREFLDLPGFTFVLAFDNEIVANGLVATNQAWKDGGDFLNKILDFHFYLPPVSKLGKRQLLRNMLAHYCPFIPDSAIDPIESLLPANPRKLKTLVRGLVSLQPQLARHGAFELNWVEICLAEMVRQESYPFFMRLLAGDTLDRLVGVGYRLRKAEPKKKSGEDSSDENADIRKIIDEVGGITSEQAGRLIELIKTTRILAGQNLAYSWSFALRPEAVTWKEFYALSERWKQNQTPETLAAWIAEHANTRSIDSAELESDLFETLMNAGYNAASEAAEARTIEENAAHCAEAGNFLRMTGDFLALPGMLTAGRFAKLYERSLYWTAFRINQADAGLRQAELELIHSLIERADGHAPGMLDALRPSEEAASSTDNEDTAQLKTEIRRECVNRLLPRVEQAFIAYLARPESFRLLASPQGSAAFRFLLFSPQSLPWSGALREALFAVLNNAKNEANDFEKTTDLLQILVDASRNRSPYLSLHAAELLAKDRDFVLALWSGATSRHIQFRMQPSYLARRSVLMELGAREVDLPLSQSLTAAYLAAQAQKGA